MMLSNNCAENLVRLLDRIKHDYPDQVLVVEAPRCTMSMKLGDALIYDDPHGWVVIDSERHD